MHNKIQSLYTFSCVYIICTSPSAFHIITLGENVFHTTIFSSTLEYEYGSKLSYSTQRKKFVGKDNRKQNSFAVVSLGMIPAQTDPLCRRLNQQVLGRVCLV